ncbi:protein of unknown function [Bradyrhizobium vignae]|uniref:Uncharacterized protein n=1 Tax=Bradyrhizobium vignae TaxID=1549949 RepID=A0A2U3PVN1_9BRAD|nr:protein of unknown function [Bradyrhizobium vignae]
MPQPRRKAELGAGQVVRAARVPARALVEAATAEQAEPAEPVPEGVARPTRRLSLPAKVRQAAPGRQIPAPR